MCWNSRMCTWLSTAQWLARENSDRKLGESLPGYVKVLSSRVHKESQKGAVFFLGYFMLMWPHSINFSSETVSDYVRSWTQVCLWWNANVTVISTFRLRRQFCWAMRSTFRRYSSSNMSDFPPVEDRKPIAMSRDDNTSQMSVRDRISVMICRLTVEFKGS